VTYPGVGTSPLLPTETLTGKPLQNGRLGPCDLTPVYLPGSGTGSLHPYTKRAWDALCVMAVADLKVTLTATDLAAAYRSFAQQETLFRSRYQTVYNPLTCLTTYKVWNGVKWYQRRGTAIAAVPGTSNHGFGIAVDTAVWLNGRIVSVASQSLVFNWLLREAASFGFSWELNSEPWHIRHMVGNDVTQRVKDVEAYLAAVNG
jgi:LAS superfamily LD-carboxypeptidase LdcB